MISTDTEYQRALQCLAEDAETLRRQRAALARAGLSGQELDRAMAPLLSFHAGLGEEAKTYEVSRGNAGGPAA